MAFEPAQVGLDRVHLGTRSAQLDRDGLELIFLCDDNEVVAVCVAHTVSGLIRNHRYALLWLMSARCSGVIGASARNEPAIL